ncbi:glucose 1-dehydrogenase [Nocardioides acrostichi]|uniref:Glucose 1-dehydrogenase n=1 Tax=Nocardioides acrostichi TaxID=2784339 RepID=A0A930Y585_9ACTN|nr:glucose 1-dehydrogenase [Nocardioides acrostichi]MBF4161000.1 glucose 1-dehydrogenase [Nocardioides acrostichi]
MGRCDGKVAIITGGASGMGAAGARMLVAEGAEVVIGDIQDELGRSLAAELGESARFVHLDVAQQDQWEAAVAFAVAEFGSLSVLVNNAGIANGALVQQFDMGQWQRAIDINLTGTFLGIRAASDALIASGRGSIINVSSIEGIRGTPWAHAYVATKWAVRGLTKSVAMELAPHNVRVNSVHPGLIKTPMTAGIPDDMIPIPLGRPGQPEEIGHWMVFLASDESSFATGAEYVVDGGTVQGVPHK